MFNYFLFRGSASKLLEAWAKKKIVKKRRQSAEERDRLLIAQSVYIQWGSGRELDKAKIVKAINGDGVTPKPDIDEDAKCMRLFLSRLDPKSLQNLEITPWSEFVPETSPLIDYLILNRGE